MNEFRGAIIARNRAQAQIGLDRMTGILGDVPYARSIRDWVVLSPHGYQGVRGCLLPNRVLVFEMEPHEIPDDLWFALIPALRRNGGEPINVYHFSQARKQPLTISDHVFTVVGLIGPLPPEHPCAFVDPVSGPCRLRADQHKTVPLARG